LKWRGREERGAVTRAVGEGGKDTRKKRGGLCRKVGGGWGGGVGVGIGGNEKSGEVRVGTS